MKRILLIEEDISLQSNLLIFLKYNGYEVITTSCDEGIKKVLQEIMPDLVICSCEKNRKIKNIYSEKFVFQELPAIIMSNDEEDESLSHIKKKKGCAIIQKPFSVFQLIELIGRILK